MSEIKILKEMLINNYYSRISIGDTYNLFFDDFWLIAINVATDDEKDLNDFLLSNYSRASEAIDAEDVAKCTVLAATLRKKITNVNLLADATLECIFENGVKLQFTTDTEIVDWHWALNNEAKDPYAGCIIGCFNPGEVHIGNC